MLSASKILARFTVDKVFNIAHLETCFEFMEFIFSISFLSGSSGYMFVGPRAIFV